MTDRPDGPCDEPPCSLSGPFRYCPVKGCGWVDDPTDDEAVMGALKRAVEARREDTAFMERLRRNIETHGVLLERLAQDG